MVTIPNPHSRPMRSLRPSVMASALSALLIPLALTGCGGSDQQSTANLPDQLQQLVSLRYSKDSAGHGPRRVGIAQGKIVYVKVKSDVAGEVSIKRLDIGQHVQAGKDTVLIFSADDPGVYDVTLNGEAIDAELGQLVVSKK